MPAFFVAGKSKAFNAETRRESRGGHGEHGGGCVWNLGRGLIGSRSSVRSLQALRNFAGESAATTLASQLHLLTEVTFLRCRWALLPAPGLRRRLRGRRVPCGGGGRLERCGRIRGWFSNPCG